MYCIAIWVINVLFFLLRVYVLVLAYRPFLFYFLHEPVLM